MATAVLDRPPPVFKAHEVRDVPNAQAVTPWPIEGWCDPLTGRRFRREFLGQCHGGVLIIGSVGNSCNLYYRRQSGDPNKPRLAELDADLKRLIARCWTQMLRKTGKPLLEKQGNLWFLTRLPVGDHRVKNVGDGSALFRLMPLIPRPCGRVPA